MKALRFHAAKDLRLEKIATAVQTGVHPHENPLDWFEVTFKDIDIRGSWAYPTHCWPRVIRLISTGLSKVVTKKFPSIRPSPKVSTCCSIRPESI
jgi:threonine dehydrogenase-like Zn-dependent dehydrogenase